MSKTEDYGWTAEDPESSSYINPAVIALARAAGASRVLDAGCGNGALAVQLAAAGFTVTGIDGDATGIEHARGRGAPVRFEVADFALAPADQGLLADGPFDAVVSTEVVEDLYAPHELARFAYQALRPGGTLVISTPYHGYLKNLALALAGKWDHHLTANWHGGHIKFWSRATLGRLLTDAGFQITGFQGVGRLPFLWKSMILIARKPEGGA